MKRTAVAGVIAMLWGGIFLLCQASPAHALEHLKGKEALDYVGDVKARFTGGEYSYEILKRSHRDGINGRFSDAVIFNRRGDKFLYVKRTDGYHRIVLNDPEGRQEDPVTAEPHVWRPLANTLSDDHPHPHVFLDDEKNEIAVVYIGRRTQLKAKTTREGLLKLELRVRGGDKGNTARMKRKRRS